MVNQKLIFHIVIYRGDVADFWLSDGEFFSDFDREYVGDLIGIWCKSHSLHLITLANQRDHLHLLVEQLDERPVQQLVNRLVDDIRNWHQNRNAELSGLSFALFTVSFSQVEKLIRFINTQNDHHEFVTFDEELTALLDKHDVSCWTLPPCRFPSASQIVNGRIT